jgi:hypothetical protein
MLCCDVLWSLDLALSFTLLINLSLYTFVHVLTSQRMGLEFYAVHCDDPAPVAQSLSSSAPALLAPGARLSSRYWHALLDTLHKSGQYTMLLEVVDSMSDVHVIPDKHCKLRYVQASLATGQYNQAIQIAERMRETSALSDIEEPDLDIYKPILLYLATNDLPEEVVRVIELMDAAGVAIDSDTWGGVERMRRFDIVLENFERNKNTDTRSLNDEK